MARTATPEQQKAFYAVRRSSVDRLAVPDLEKRGFEALLERDYDVAQQTITEAVRIWPDYHNVAEIGKLLSANRTKLTGGVPPQYLARMRAAAGK